MMAMNYGRAYVAHIAMGGNDGQTMKAFLEAEAYDGPSLIIAYSHCIAHGYDMVYGIDQQKAAVNSGHWPLFRYNPSLATEGKNPFVLDSRAPSIPLEKYIYNETRYTMLVNSNPEEAKKLLQQAQENVNERWKLYQHMAAMNFEKAKQSEERIMIDLSTNYLGLKLQESDRGFGLAADGEAGELSPAWKMPAPSAIVMYSLLEEQIEAESENIDNALEYGANSYAESTSVTCPTCRSITSGPTAIWSCCTRARSRSSIPVIASLNGTSPGGWVALFASTWSRPAPTRWSSISSTSLPTRRFPRNDLEDALLRTRARHSQERPHSDRGKARPILHFAGQLRQALSRSRRRWHRHLQPLLSARLRPGGDGGHAEPGAEQSA